MPCIYFLPTNTKQKITTPSFLLLLLPPPLHHPPPHPHPRRQPPPSAPPRPSSIERRATSQHPTPVPPPPPSSTLPPSFAPPPPPPPTPAAPTIGAARPSATERSPTSQAPHPGSSSSSFLHPSTILRRTPTPSTNPRRPLTVRAAGGKFLRNNPHVNIRTSASHWAASAAAAGSPLAHCHSAPSPCLADPPCLNAPLLLLHHASATAVGILPFWSRVPSSIPVVVALPLRFQVTFPSAMVFTWCFPWSHLTWSYSAEVDATNCIYYGPVNLANLRRRNLCMHAEEACAT
ncbi:hypothetical protein Fmac_008012 [Flemingia macrophylla]|uniref:Uncharacterized protein n=1 Tax=Flemingia macrophylla TaxID=520843 RepID=A0ABD1MW79_9FABA